MLASCGVQACCDRADQQLVARQIECGFEALAGGDFVFGHGLRFVIVSEGEIDLAAREYQGDPVGHSGPECRVRPDGGEDQWADPEAADRVSIDGGVGHALGFHGQLHPAGNGIAHVADKIPQCLHIFCGLEITIDQNRGPGITGLWEGCIACPVRPGWRF